MTDLDRLLLWNLLGFVENCEFLSQAPDFAGEDPQYAKGIRTAYGEVARSLDNTIRNCFSPQAYKAIKDKIQKRNKEQAESYGRT